MPPRIQPIVIGPPLCCHVMKGTQTIKPLARENEIKEGEGGECSFLQGSEPLLPLYALGVLVQNTDQHNGWQVGSSETPAVQTAARQMPAPALGHCPAGEIPPAEAD